MLVIPAVDLMDGKCVRLVQGDPKRAKVYFENPIDAARWLESEGANFLHIVDLDAAMSRGENAETIASILRLSLIHI